MKAILFALFVALLMGACMTTKTKDDPEVEAKETSSANQPAERPDPLTDLDFDQIRLDAQEKKNVVERNPGLVEMQRKIAEMKKQLEEIPIGFFSGHIDQIEQINALEDNLEMTLKLRKSWLESSRSETFEELLLKHGIVPDDNDANKTGNGEAVED